MSRHSNKYSYLDKVRINHGNDKCKAVFHETFENSRQKAIDLLNDRRITFPCFFILLPQINSLKMSSKISSRGSITMEMVNQIIDPKKSGRDVLKDKNAAVHSVLRWILETGKGEYELNDSFQKILDITVSILINTYKDNSVLPIVDEMIFKRKKKGQNIHNLVWAFFSSRNPDTLKLTARHILSPNPREADFARSLINPQASDKENENDSQRQYEDYMKWLEENASFLYFTGESHQFTSKPVICKVNLEKSIE